MTKVNRLFLFLFACIPGAGQMYLGYMKRGLCLISAACVNIILAAMISDYLVVTLVIVWMFSFFDTYNLRRQLLSENYPEDDYLFKLPADESVCRLLRIRSRFVGWALIALGGFALYDNVIMPMIYEFADRFEWLWPLTEVLRQIPDLIVAVALILVGVWLVKGKNQPADDDIPTYGEDR